MRHVTLTLPTMRIILKISSHGSGGGGVGAGGGVRNFSVRMCRCRASGEFCNPMLD